MKGFFWQTVVAAFFSFFFFSQKGTWMWQLRLSDCIFLFRKICWHRPACLPQLSDGKLTGNSPHFILTMGHGFLSAFIRRLWRIVCRSDRSLQTPDWNQRTGNSIRSVLQISFVEIFLMVQFCWILQQHLCQLSDCKLSTLRTDFPD